jgi:hypothetical protein
MVGRFFKEVEEAFKRGIEKVPVVVMNRDELEREMIRAVEANPGLSDQQKMHAIENILRYNLADVSWFSKEYQAYRIKKLALLNLAGRPMDEINQTTGLVERSYRTGRLREALELSKREMIRDVMIFLLAQKFVLPLEEIQTELDSLVKAGFLELRDGRYVLTIKGRTLLEGGI